MSDDVTPWAPEDLILMNLAEDFPTIGDRLDAMRPAFAQMRAEAWDEGVAADQEYIVSGVESPNPYRA